MSYIETLINSVSHAHLLDNWTLQNAGEFLHRGLDGDTTNELSFSADGADFHYVEKSADLMRLEALCQTLHHTVFAESLCVDADFAEAWQEFAALRALQDGRLLVTKPFKAVAGEWIERREAMVDELCSCPGIRRKHEENRLRFEAHEEPADQFLSQLVWGGAGMLARADYFGLIYVPHPARESLLTRARFLRGPAPAQEQVQSFIQTQRLKLYRHVDGSGFFARFQLPPVVVQIINETSDLENLPRVALQLRDEYSELRKWLGEFQAALDAESVSELLSKKNLLEGVARNIDSQISLTPVGDSTVQFGLSWLKVTTKAGSPLNALRNHFGVRSQLNRLALAPPGRASLKKLLRLLGEQHTERGLALEKDFLRRSTPQPS